MASQVTAQCFLEQETGFLVDETGNKLQAKSMVMHKSTPYVVTEEGDIDHFTGGKMENIYHVDDRYSDYHEEQVKELKAEKNQSFLANMFRALTCSRHRTMHRQVTGIQLTLITLGLTPVMDLEVITAAIPPVPCEEWIKPAQEQLVPLSLVEASIQPSVDNKFGGSYITEAQVMQVQNISCDISISNSDAVTQEYLKINI